MLHWIAENLNGTSDALRKLIATDGGDPGRRQTARSIVVVVLAKQKEVGEAENLLAEYLKSEPKKLTERVAWRASWLRHISKAILYEWLRTLRLIMTRRNPS